MSSISNTSTVLTDLSVRLEKIEDMLSRLLDAQKPPPRGGGDGGGGGSGGGGRGDDDNDAPSRQARSRSLGIQQVEHGRGHATGQTNGVSGVRPPTVDEESAAGFAGAVRDTSLELREVRGRLRLLEVDEAARVATAIPEADAVPTSRVMVGTSVQLSSEPPPLSGARSTNPTPPAERHAERYALAAAGSAAGSGGGGNAGDNLIRGAPASELPVFEQEDEEEEGVSSEAPFPREASAVPPSEHAVDRDAAEDDGAASASSCSVAVNSGFEPARGAEKGDSRDSEEKGEGEGDGDGVKSDGWTSPPGGRLAASALRRPRSFILSTISEAPV